MLPTKLASYSTSCYKLYALHGFNSLPDKQHCGYSSGPIFCELLVNLVSRYSGHKIGQLLQPQRCLFGGELKPERRSKVHLCVTVEPVGKFCAV